MNHEEPYKDNYLQDILSSVKTIAMVGASPDKTKFSYGVLRVLHETGYDMIPVNPKPGLKEIRGLKVFPNLKKINQHFSKDYKPYVIGKISKNSKSCSTFGKYSNEY